MGFGASVSVLSKWIHVERYFIDELALGQRRNSIFFQLTSCLLHVSPSSSTPRRREFPRPSASPLLRLRPHRRRARNNRSTLTAELFILVQHHHRRSSSSRPSPPRHPRSTLTSSLGTLKSISKSGRYRCPLRPRCRYHRRRVPRVRRNGDELLLHPSPRCTQRFSNTYNMETSRSARLTPKMPGAKQT